MKSRATCLHVVIWGSAVQVIGVSKLVSKHSLIRLSGSRRACAASLRGARTEELIATLSKSQCGQVQHPDDRSCGSVSKGQMCHSLRRKEG